MLEFRPFDAIGPGQWDAVVHASPEGWAWSTSQWRRMILNVTEWGLQDFSFAAVDGERLVGVMPLQYQAASRRMSSTGWSAGGVTIAADVDDADRSRITDEMLGHARALAVEQGAATFEITLSPLRRASLAAPYTNPMNQFGFDDLSTQTLVADLRVPEETLWMSLSKDARQAVKKAERSGYRAISGGWATHAEAYYPVHVETYTRTGVQPHPRRYFEGFEKEMAPAGLAELWVGLAPDGRPVAFHNDTHFHHARVYHTGCSETAHLDSGINYLLFWAAIKGARDAGCQWYEIGEIFPDAVDGKTRGLTVFKSKFGGQPHKYFRARQVLEQPAAAPPVAAPSAATSEADRVTRAVFSKGSVYEPSRICRRIERDAPDYAGQLLLDRFDMVAAFNNGGTLVDLCCASGSHLVDISPDATRAIGIDFAERYLETGKATALAAGRDNVAFLQGDARQLPLASGSVDTLYCFSALYAIPRVEEVVAEVGRVLRPGGHAVLDFGNRRSLNAYCGTFYTDLAPLHLLSVGEIRGLVRRAGLSIVKHRRFQLLPLWAGRPEWLWPLLHPRWKTVMKRRIFGRMLDEWLSMMPILRSFAFRHVLVCRKDAGGIA
jgi:SAM-dependent methyltransferase